MISADYASPHSDLYQVFRAGLNSSGCPLGNLLFLGPARAGKTSVVEAVAEVLFGNPQAMQAHRSRQ